MSSQAKLSEITDRRTKGSSGLRSERELAWIAIALVTIQVWMVGSVALAQQRQYEQAWHSVGELGLMVTNYGSLGAVESLDDYYVDVFTGEFIYLGSEYPRNSGLTLLGNVNYWVGGILDGDTLVSKGRGTEHVWDPETIPFGSMECRSSLWNSDCFDSSATSQQDFICSYADTVPVIRRLSPDPNQLVPPPHQPLFVEIEQSSRAWSFDYSEDLILFHMKIRNLGEKTIEQMYFGLNVLPGIGAASRDICTSCDDVSGFVARRTLANLCNFQMPVNVAWSADNDGDLVDGEFNEHYVPYRSARHSLGVRFLGNPDLKQSFNWWRFVRPSEPATLDYGPRRLPIDRDLRQLGSGYPEGDANGYYMLSNEEIDFAIPFSAVVQTRDGWGPPSLEQAIDLGDGVVHEYLLSIGGIDVPPGGVFRVGFAVIAGENIHRDPDNFEFLPDRPGDYYDNLDFSDLVTNAVWADWIFDNPGVDTDNNGYAGEYHVCVLDSVLLNGEWHASVAETLWVKGDGVPDWKAAGPPPAPDFWVTPIENGIHVRFNGHRSETEVDIFSRIIDFEGYRVYLGRDTRRENMAVVASYDVYDFDQWVFRPDLDTFGVWQIQSIPFTLDSLRCLYGRGNDPCDDMSFDPLSTAAHRPYHHPDFPESTFYFTPHEYNVSELGMTTPITKIYPEVPDPSHFHPDSIPEDHYTEDGYLKYYEYEFTIENLLPTVPYYVNVTAFDFGSPKGRLEALETSNTLGAKRIYPLAHGASPTASGNLNVYIYPNPYRIDGNYRDHGYEGRMREDRPDYRVREIHFANLPAKCKISIFSLDGDLIRSIDHDLPESDPNHTHDSWDMITRNTQEPVSGLYYWVVEASDGRTQIGKLVLIM